MYVASFIAHRYLYNRLGILHCDLSINNILLIRKDNESEATGLLIDYDYSIDAGSEAPKHQELQQTVPSAPHTSGRGTAEGTLSKRRVAVANAVSGVPSDTSELETVQSRGEKAQGGIPRTVCCALLHCRAVVTF